MYEDFKPLPIDNPGVRAFGAMGEELRRYAPMYQSYHDADVPDDFRPGVGRGTLWNEVVSQWFFGGLKHGDRFTPKEGIDAAAALTHVGCVLRSFEPGHGTKEAICAYLLSLWFEDFEPCESHSEVFRRRVAQHRT